MTKIEKLLESVDLSSCPHVGSYGEERSLRHKGIAVIVVEVDDDENDSWTEITEEEKTTARRLLRPHQVTFHPGLMRTFSEWLHGVPRRKNPITGKVFFNERRQNSSD